MDNEGMARFICELRKSKKMTQKQLAEKLNLTDKAVSKWERGSGYPDISVLTSLAEILGVTTTELLKGKREKEYLEETEKVIETTIEYANKVTTNKQRKISKIMVNLITVTFILSMAICIICNLAISQNLTWALYPIYSLMFAWLIIIPIFYFKKFRIRIALISLSIFICPFLILLKTIVGEPFNLDLGIAISIASIIFLWIIYIMFSNKKINRWNAVSLTFFFTIPYSLFMDFIISKFLKEPMMNVWNALSLVALGIVSILLFYIGSVNKAKEV